MKKILMPVALVAAMGLWACTDDLTMPDVLAPSLASFGYVVQDPTLPENDPNPGSTCPDGVDGWLKVDDASGDWGSFSYEDDTLTYTVEDGYIVQFCIKSGESEGTTFYEIEGYESDQITIGKDISHTAYRVIFIPEGNGDGGEWCSPGFWRNNPIAAGEAADAGGFNLGDLYSAHFGEAPNLSPQGQRDNAPVDPTLWEVLSNPQWYGGEAFNNVGDLLSDAHPDVDFQGERVEDGCPLSADASQN
jgi:hypothetical protein